MQTDRNLDFGGRTLKDPRLFAGASMADEPKSKASVASSDQEFVTSVDAEANGEITQKPTEEPEVTGKDEEKEPGPDEAEANDGDAGAVRCVGR